MCDRKRPRCEPTLVSCRLQRGPVRTARLATPKLGQLQRRDLSNLLGDLRWDGPSPNTLGQRARLDEGQEVPDPQGPEDSGRAARGALPGQRGSRRLPVVAGRQCSAVFPLTKPSAARRDGDCRRRQWRVRRGRFRPDPYTGDRAKSHSSCHRKRGSVSRFRQKTTPRPRPSIRGEPFSRQREARTRAAACG